MLIKLFQNYSHMNQSLAHPLGANFKEIINIVKFKNTQNYLISLKTNYIKIGLDSINTHFGQNIFISDFIQVMVESTFLWKL